MAQARAVLGQPTVAGGYVDRVLGALAASLSHQLQTDDELAECPAVPRFLRSPCRRRPAETRSETCGRIRPSRYNCNSSSISTRAAAGIALHVRPVQHAEHVAALEQRQVERQVRNLAAGKSNDEVAPAPGDRADGGLGINVADGIADDIDAFGSAALLEYLRELPGRRSRPRRSGYTNPDVAPRDSARSTFSWVEAAAITCAPLARPSSTAARPMPPPAPSTSSRSPARRCARRFRP